MWEPPDCAVLGRRGRGGRGKSAKGPATWGMDCLTLQHALSSLQLTAQLFCRRESTEAVT